jgi:hypothetical protein
MPKARDWSAEQDGVIVGMRAQGETWSAISHRLGLPRATVIERGRRLRAAPPPPSPAEKLVPGSIGDPNRDALPAGHPLTWRLLAVGILEGTAYPGFAGHGRLE